MFCYWQETSSDAACYLPNLSFQMCSENGMQHFLNTLSTLSLKSFQLTRTLTLNTQSYPEGVSNKFLKEVFFTFQLYPQLIAACHLLESTQRSSALTWQCVFVKSANLIWTTCTLARQVSETVKTQYIKLADYSGSINRRQMCSSTKKNLWWIKENLVEINKNIYAVLIRPT